MSFYREWHVEFYGYLWYAVLCDEYGVEDRRRSFTSARLGGQFCELQNARRFL